MTTHLVFVYGSLKAGFHNHQWLAEHDATDLGYAVTDARYLMVRGNAFPYLINPAHFTTPVALPESPVGGELYRVDDAGLAALDRLEGHPRFYRRELISVNDGLQAWAYFLTRPSERWDHPEHFIANALATPNAQGIVEWTRDDVFATANYVEE